MKVVIVGGVAGGASAAARLRRLDEKSQIVLFERGDHISFANCGLPYYIGGVIEEEEDLLLQTPESFNMRFNVDVRIRAEVTAVHPDAHLVEVFDHATGRSYDEAYDKLVLSPGAAPVKPISGDRVFTVSTVNDAVGIRSYCADSGAESALVVGGGFIGVETAENLIHLGLAVTLVEKAPHVMPNLDAEMAAAVQKKLNDLGAVLVLGCGLASYDGTTAILEDGSKYTPDIIVCAIGVKPNDELAKQAGMLCAAKGGIVINGRLETSAPDVYAIGDATVTTNIVSGMPAYIPLAGPANKQGRAVADIICGMDTSYKGTQGTSILKIDDMTVASSGLSERALLNANIPYLKSYTRSFPHATYYPGGRQMLIKLMYSPSGDRILGSQIVGYEAVDKAMDLLAASIRFGLSVDELCEMESAYAPPFSSAKSPVNMAGLVAQNIINGLHKVFFCEDIPSLDPKHDLLIDIRTPNEYAAGTIPGAINLPLDDIRERYTELPTDKNLFIFCRIGQRGFVGYRILCQLGFKHVYNLSGGYLSYAMGGCVHA